MVAGSAVTYTLLLGNVGPSAASSVTLTDALPDGLTVLPDGLSTSGGTCATNPARNQVSCDFGTLLVAGSAKEPSSSGRWSPPARPTAPA